MYDFKSLICYNCKSVILNLPKSEISKLNGLNFQCELWDIEIFLLNLHFLEALK